MINDRLSGIADGIDGVINGFHEDGYVYRAHYIIGRRIVAGAAGLTCREVNIIKMLHGFCISETTALDLKTVARDCMNQGGAFSEVFELGENGNYT